MTRVLAAVTALPFLLVALLIGAGHVWDDTLGKMLLNYLVLGPLPMVLAAFLVIVAISLPLTLVATRFMSLSLWLMALVGGLSGILAVVVPNWSVLIDGRLRIGFRFEKLAEGYPVMLLGVAGGALFWLLAVFRNRELQRWALERARGAA